MQALVGADGVVAGPREARALLDDLPGLVCLAPEVTAPEEARGGPVVLALRPHEDAGGAARFAQGIALALGRELLITHVLELPSTRELSALSSSAAERWQRYQRHAGLSAVADFMDRHDLYGVPIEIRAEPVADGIARVAEAAGASVVVCGSRSLPGGRSFSGATPMSVARVGRRPVVVVPPRYRGSSSPRVPWRQ